jgi:hypothetical protein
VVNPTARRYRTPYCLNGYEMTIDKSGKWWRGSEFGDVVQYLREYTADGYPVRSVVQCVCECRGTAFKLEGDRDEGCARRTCVACERQAFIGDSAEFWDEAKPKLCRCPACKGVAFEIGVGFSLRDDGDVRWITIGQRCLKCGLLGSFVDWSIDYGPADHLLRQI